MSEEAASVAPRGRDLREGGVWSPFQRAKNFALFVVITVVVGLLRWLPTSALVRLGRLAGRLAFALRGRPRRVAQENLRRVFPSLRPDERDGLLERNFVELGSYLGDAIAQLHGKPGTALLPFTIGGRRALDDAIAEGNGVLFVSAHLGPWERVARSLVAHGIPLTTIARESYDPRLSRLYDRLRGGASVGVIYRGRPDSGPRMRGVLQRGGVLGAPMDLRTRVRSVDVPFLGHLAPTPIGPAKLARGSGAAVVVGTAVRSGAELAIDTTRVDATGLGAGQEGDRELTARINDELSRRILAFPEGWVWMHERFR